MGNDAKSNLLVIGYTPVQKIPRIEEIEMGMRLGIESI